MHALQVPKHLHCWGLQSTMVLLSTHNCLPSCRCND